MIRVEFATGEYYHIYNRGVDKRDIFNNEYDLRRFFLAINEFNTIEPIGSIYEETFQKKKPRRRKDKLVEFICYCLNPNHFHLILEQLTENGIPKFMHRLSTGYTMYFNKKYGRSGALFQGRYKALHINTNDYLLHLSVYVNLNNRLHPKLGGSTSKFTKSSWVEYVSGKPGQKSFCEKEIILNQFKNRTEYRKFAQDTLPDIVERKQEEKELERLLID